MMLLTISTYGWFADPNPHVHGWSDVSAQDGFNFGFAGAGYVTSISSFAIGG